MITMVIGHSAIAKPSSAAVAMLAGDICQPMNDTTMATMREPMLALYASM